MIIWHGAAHCTHQAKRAVVLVHVNLHLLVLHALDQLKRKQDMSMED